MSRASRSSTCLGADVPIGVKDMPRAGEVKQRRVVKWSSGHVVECGETEGQRSRVRWFQFPDDEKLVVRWAGLWP